MKLAPEIEAYGEKARKQLVCSIIIAETENATTYKESYTKLQVCKMIKPFPLVILSYRSTGKARVIMISS
jgi:hypothetical protein